MRPVHGANRWSCHSLHHCRNPVTNIHFSADMAIAGRIDIACLTNAHEAFTIRTRKIWQNLIRLNYRIRVPIGRHACAPLKGSFRRPDRAISAACGVAFAFRCRYTPRLALQRSEHTVRAPALGRQIMKVKNSLRSLKNRHRDCRVVRRKGRVYVINKTQRRFKARQG